MDLNEMEETKPVVAVVVDESYDDDNEQMLIDLHDAIAVIEQAKVLIDFLGDPVLCRAIAKRERDTLARLSFNMKEFLGNMEASYGEDR